MVVRRFIGLTGGQFQAFSEISRDIGQVFFASMVVTPFLIGIDRINWTVVLSGGILSLVFWFLSVFLVRKGE